MPVITLSGPKLTKEQKAEIVKLFTEAASKVTNIPAQAFIVQIQEMDREMWVSAGFCSPTGTNKWVYED